MALNSFVPCTKYVTIQSIDNHSVSYDKAATNLGLGGVRTCSTLLASLIFHLFSDSSSSLEILSTLKFSLNRRSAQQQDSKQLCVVFIFINNFYIMNAIKVSESTCQQEIFLHNLLLFPFTHM